jgi:hypothetical protein
MSNWVLVEVSGGVVDVDHDESVGVLVIDWDDLADDLSEGGYADSKLEELDGLAMQMPPELVDRLRKAIGARR